MNILILVAHPEKDSLCEANAKALVKAAKAQKHTVKVLHTIDYPLLDTNPIKSDVPEIFNKAADEISKADFIAIVSPMWNFGGPASLKNFLDGALQNKKAYVFEPKKWLKWLNNLPGMKFIIPGAKPRGLLKIKKILCVWTADGPMWHYALHPGQNLLFKLIKQNFGFAGVKKFEQMRLGMTHKRDEKQIQTWLKKLESYTF